MKVSIIIPCFNVAAYVERALKSALEQTYIDTEIICIDNNSTDATPNMLRDYQAQYPDRIKVLHEKRQGAPAARNLGLQHATGAWIQFLDADDELLPEKLERQMQLIHQNRTAFLIGTATYVDLRGQENELTAWEDPWLGLAHGRYAGHTVANLYQYEMLVQLAGWTETLPYLQDFDLCFRILKHRYEYQIDFLASCRYYDRPSGKITQQDPVGMYAAALRLGYEINCWLQENRADYWSQNQMKFQTALLRKVKLLATYDIDQAMLLAQEYLPVDFVPPIPNKFDLAAWHRILYPLMGLERTERLKHFLVHRFLKPWYKVER